MHFDGNERGLATAEVHASIAARDLVSLAYFPRGRYCLQVKLFRLWRSCRLFLLFWCERLIGSE